MKGIFGQKIEKKRRDEKEQFYHNSKIAIRRGIEIIRDDSETRESQHKTILGKSRQVV